MTKTKPLWGHPLLTPEGVEIRLPASAFPTLRQLGLLVPNKNRGMFQLSSLIDAFLEPECDGLMNGIRRLLGKELEGPDWLLCKCRQCQKLHEDADRTPMPKRPEEEKRGRYWLKVIRAPRHPVGAERN